MEQKNTIDLISHTPGENVTANRNKYLGGSDLPALFNTGSFKDYITLVREKAGVIPVEFKGNEYTRYGQLLEPQIRDYINAIYDLKFKENTNINEDLKLRSNCDGLDLDAGILLEIKTNAGDKKTYEDVFDYILQMQLYMLQFGVTKGYLVQYARPENFWMGLDYETQHTDEFFNQDFDPARISVMEINRDDNLISEILKKAEKFWQDVEKVKANPNMTEQEIYFGDSITEYKNTITKLENLETQLLVLKELEEEAKNQKEILYSLMDKYNVKSLATDKMLITRVIPTESSQLDSTKLKKEMPEIAEKYQKIVNKKGYVKITVREHKINKKTIDIKDNVEKSIEKSDALAALGL